MSILLSAYFPEGIVFAADRNATVVVQTGTQSHRWVEPTLTKVLSWPNHRAAVGYVGVAILAGLQMDEWLRVFIAGTRGFGNVDDLATELRDRVQADFRQDYGPGADLASLQLVLHLGGFADRKGTPVPVMCHVWNHGPIDPQTGHYPTATRDFQISEDFERDFRRYWPGHAYPEAARERLDELLSRQQFLWYNNGLNIGAFNVFKGFLWRSLNAIREAGFADQATGLAARAAYCKMAVEVFGAYYTHHYLPMNRGVGGGVDVVQLPWP